MSDKRVKGLMPAATMSVEEYAQLMGVSRNTAYEAVKTGSLPSIKIGKRILISRKVAERQLEGQQAA